MWEGDSMGMSMGELRSRFESKLNMAGAPMRCSIDLEDGRDDLGIVFPARLSDEVSLHSDNLIFDQGDARNVSPEARTSCGRKALDWPRMVLESLVEECVRGVLEEACPPLGDGSMEEWGYAPSAWDVPRLREYLSEEGADPCMRYPAGSIVRMCGCGAVFASDVCAIAFSPQSEWDFACPRCGKPSRLGVSRCEGFQLPEGWVFASRGRDGDKCYFVHPSDWYFVMNDLSEMIKGGILSADRKELAFSLWKAKGGMGFEEALAFLVNHPIYDGRFFECTDFDLAMVCSRTKKHESSDSRFANDAWEVWVESGPYIVSDDYSGLSHDVSLDCGGWSFEEAVVHLAHLVRQRYGNGGSRNGSFKA